MPTHYVGGDWVSGGWIAVSYSDIDETPITCMYGILGYLIGRASRWTFDRSGFSGRSESKRRASTLRINGEPVVIA